MTSPIKTNATILSIFDITTTTKEIRLKLHQPISHLAGQWIDFFVLIDNIEYIAGYTLCNEAGESDQIDIAVRKSSHPVSRWLHETAKIGDNVDIFGGCGSCTYTPTEGDHVAFLVGGIGITPVLSMLRTISKSQLSLTASLYYSVRNPEDILYKEELQKLDDRVDIFYRHTALESRWSESDLMPSLRTKNHIFVFGPSDMIQYWDYHLSANGLQDRLHLENW